MGYFKPPETDQLVLPSNSEFWVRMKRRAEFSDGEAAKGSMIKFSTPEPNGHTPTANDVLTQTEITAYNTVLISRMVTEWNLTDDKEQVQPITLATIGRLDPDDGDFLAEEAMKRRGGRTEKDQANFPKPSGRRSTGTR